MTIADEKTFKSALEGLSTPQQRYVGALFVENVLHLSEDNRLKGLLNAAKRADISDDELLTLYQAGKTAVVDSYTQCGREIDWLSQAGHFVAEAATACVALAPPGKSDNPAWNAAMHARMARTCECIAQGESTEKCEMEAQYAILNKYLATQG